MDKKENKNNNRDGFDPKAKAEARKQEMDKIMTKLEAGVKDVFKSENFKSYLKLCSRLPRYSVNNQLLILMAKPDATMCMSFNKWRELGRTVKRGEKGIRILAPAPYKMMQEQDKKDSFGTPVLDKDGEPVKEMVEVEIHAFKPVSTFDVSQTEGEPLPSPGVDELIGDVDGYKELFDAIVQVAGIPVEFEKIDSGAKGYYNMEDNRIAIKEGMSEVHNLKTLLHEVSHSKLHARSRYDGPDKKSKNQKETEAESVAYICCQHYGLDTSEYSFPYLATWAGEQDVSVLKSSLDTIKGAASEIITKVDDILRAKAAEKYVDAIDAEMPFDKEFEDADSSRPAGFIVIEPPIDAKDLAELDKKNEIELTASGEELKPKACEPKETEPVKKKSVMDKLAKGKEKAANEPRKEKKAQDKHKEKMQEAI